MKRFTGGLLIVSLLSSFSGFAKEVVVVNGKSLTDSDLEGSLLQLNEGQRKSVLNDAEIKRQTVQVLVNHELMAQEATKMKLDQDPYVKAQIEHMRRQVLATKLLEAKVAPKLTPDALKKYYEEHKARFSVDHVHVLQILLKDEAEAQKIFKLASAPDADFQALAEKHSKDPSAVNNRGDLGYIAQNQMSPEFTVPVFSYPVGKVSGPFKTSFGYHIVKIQDRKVGNVLSYHEAEGMVKNAYAAELAKELQDQLRAGASVKLAGKN